MEQQIIELERKINKLMTLMDICVDCENRLVFTGEALWPPRMICKKCNKYQISHTNIPPPFASAQAPATILSKAPIIQNSTDDDMGFDLFD
jgi:hypothetical protein